jgi:hypothetical protein
MNHNEFRKEISFKIVVQREQLIEWIRRLFFLNESLHKEYDSFYQQMYYIILQELFSEGLPYVQEKVNILNQDTENGNYKWFNILLKSLIEIKSLFPEDELDFIEYKRHNTCHIFQNQYERVQDNGKFKTERKNKDIKLLQNEFQKILYKYNWDKGFDVYLTTTLYPILTNLYNTLQSIRNEEENDKSNES